MNVACSICLESLTVTSDIYTTPCGHVFHYDCIQKWLASGNQHCSQCRQDCKINDIVKLYFSENESALENNNLCTQLESENLKLQQEVNVLKDRDFAANQKYTQLEFENLRLEQEVIKLKAHELGTNRYCLVLKEENKILHKRLCQGRSNSAGIDRVLKEQRKEINNKDQKIIELEAKCNQLEKAIDTIETNTKMLPEGKKSTEKSRLGITCYKCNEDGHMARRCPSAGMGRRGLGAFRGVPRGMGSFENYVDMTRVEDSEIKISKKLIMALCYLRHSKVPVEEDLTHEFKGHRDLSDLDYSVKRYTWGVGGYTSKCPRFRATLSKSICGMLNTGLKSTIYLGVTDKGTAEGFMMSLYQRDHFQLSLRDLLSKFNPPCPEHIIDVTFVPVLDEDENGIVSQDPIGFEPPRWLEHSIRDSKYCWCDNFTSSASANGFIHRFYVIELSINAWDKKNPKNASLIRADVCDQRPIFANECDKIFIRRNGSIKQVSKENLAKLKRNSYLPLKDVQIISDEQLKENETKNEDEDTDFFSYDSDSAF